MATANTISVASGKSYGNLKTLFNQVSKVFFVNKEIITSGTATATQVLITAGIEASCEFPVLEGGVTFNTGEIESTEIKLTNGSIWTSKDEKGDSDISFQVASVDDTIASLFLDKKVASVAGIKSSLGSSSEVTFGGIGYSLGVKKVNGGLIMFDQSGETMIVLPNVEMAGALVQDGDNPAYFNVKVTPKVNAQDSAIYIFNKTA